MNEYNCQLRNAEPAIQRLVNRIARMAGLEYKITVFSSDDPTACTTFFEADPHQLKKPAIRYNPIFIDQIQSVSPWAVVAVFAHEVASHYNSNIMGLRLADSLDKATRNKDLRRQIQSDRFAGWVLWHEGARLKEALELYNLPRFTSPALPDAENLRKKTMRTGWIKAFNKKVKRNQEPPSGADEASQNGQND